MPDLLLELFSEEIPARMQARAAAELERKVNGVLLEAGLMPEGVKAFATPRRLALVASGLPARQPDRREEKKGPRVGAPDKAIQGFLKSAGLSSIEECEQREDKKGAYWVAVIDRKGRDTSEIIAEAIPEILRGFSWPKSMRWGEKDLRWVRPLHSVLCAFNGEIVSFDIDGVSSRDKTYGHRFMAPDEIQTRNFDDYVSKLRATKVILDAEERKEIIAGDAATLCAAQGLELIEDEALLNEVAGLAEWPVAMIGAFDEKFLALPDEVLTAVMRGHQKYFSVRAPQTGRLANKFIFVANLEAPDGGAAMRAGYERVLAARLSDAWFLYQQDLKRPLEDRVKDLDKVTFFEGLGSLGDKARRIAALTKEIAPAVGADPGTAERAGLLAKADLVSAMVYEFPELQGVMGRYYALAQSESQEIADAIRDHYKPAGQDDAVPTAPVSVAVALADKIDTLSGFWHIDKRPSGSKDPFALRRTGIGIISIILGREIRAPLRRVVLHHVGERYLSFLKTAKDVLEKYLHEIPLIGSIKESELDEKYKKEIIERLQPTMPRVDVSKAESLFQMSFDWIEFVHDRLKVYLRDKGHRYDHIEAVLEKADGSLEDDLVLIVRKLEALEGFLKTDNGENLAILYKRATNILKAEEKNDDAPADPSAVDEKRLKAKEEKTLFEHLKVAEVETAKNVNSENFDTAMAFLSTLRAPLDAFFDNVTVNAEEPALRANRLSLLARLRSATAKVADFSKLEG